MKRESPDEVLRELGAFITEELAATQIAITCLRVVAHRALVEFEGAQDEEEVRLLGTDVPEAGWITSIPGVAGARALVGEVAEGGLTHRRLTQQWVVTVYTAWEAEFRKRLAVARDIPEHEVRADFFGDLRRLRHDIVHHRGVASRDHSTKCTTLLKRRLLPGDPIYLRDDELRWVHLTIPWSTLLRGTDV